MDKMMRYRRLMRDLLSKYADLINRNPIGDQEAQIVVDEQHDQYLLVISGWRNKRRLHSDVVHVRLQNGKFRIEHDGLENGITPDLLAAGVPREDIVLAFHHPDLRPLTEFAVT